ncbi:MAG: extracellular solute-binding protein [Clostridia bacterium]|nr:extracellular solute-binding protein [Clostridia bacterium]
MKKRFLRKISLFISLIVVMTGFFGCAQKNVASDDDNTLEVYLWNAGYGYEWLEELLKDFGTLDWVQEKYPNYSYFTVINDQTNYGEDRMAAGKGNTIDLIMSGNLDSYFGTKDLVEISDCILESDVPGENVKFKDKLLPSVYSSLGFTPYGETKTYYNSVPWNLGVGGIVYNATLFEELGLNVPRTTEEMFGIMDKVKSWNGSNAEYPFTYSYIASQITYSEYITAQWWAQYEGVQNFENFSYAIDEDGVRNSINVLYEKGRMRSWEILDRLLDEANGYYDRSSPNRDFITGQSYLLLRRGLFMFSGDWFSNEMKDLAEGYKSEGYTDTMSMMRTPVVSSLIEKLDTINDDTTLCEVIDEIDAGKTGSSVSGVSQKDFDRVKEARGVMYTNNGSCHTVIPSYATAKDLAIDFVRYMATDRANELFACYSSGGKLPYKYDFMTQSSEKYAELNKKQSATLYLQTKVSEYLQTPFTRILNNKVSDFQRYGGFNILAGSNTSDIFNTFVYTNTSAQDLYQNAIDYYTANNNAMWNTALRNAGML